MAVFPVLDGHEVLLRWWYVSPMRVWFPVGNPVGLDTSPSSRRVVDESMQAMH